MLDTAGKPSASGWARLLPTRPGAHQSIRDESIDSASVDTDGRFKFLVGPGTYRVFTGRDAPLTDTIVEVKTGESTSVELRAK